MKTRKILTLIILILFATASAFFAGCGDANDSSSSGQSSSQSQSQSSASIYTLNFIVDGEILSKIEQAESTEVAEPIFEKAGFTFDGWYLNSDFSGEKQPAPSVMPSQNLNYYGRFISNEKTVYLHYDVNLIDVEYDGDIPSQSGRQGDVFTVKDGNDFLVSGYKFLGWTTSPEQNYSFTNGTTKGQYSVGDRLTLGEESVTLYAHWAMEFTDFYSKNPAKVYIYYNLIGKGQGAAILERENAADKYGFVAIDENDNWEFTFYFSESEGGDVVGRVYNDKTYVLRDETLGTFLQYDYATDQAGLKFFSSDGYGLATVSSSVGAQLKTEFAGYYYYSETYGDYVLAARDQNGEEYVYCYFLINRQEISDIANLSGYFIPQGFESGSYMLYSNGELLNVRLDLNGYGSARLFYYDPLTETSELAYEGEYNATANYQDYTGEWGFSADGESFNFVLSQINVGEETIPVYIEYDQALDFSLTEESDNGTLNLNGYGYATYTAGGTSYYGVASFNASTNTVSFIPYVENADGTVSVEPTIYFTVDLNNSTFVVNSEGFIIDADGVLTDYKGSSKIITIPDGVTKIAEDAFNYQRTGVSVISVTVPATVTEIGARAFENDYSLSRIIFLSNTPPTADFEASVDPFRWAAGSLVIVVPEGCQDSYKTAWAKYANQIKGSEEIKILPEFEIESGILVRYNKPEDAGEKVSIVIPNEVTELAPYVFRGLDYIVSVNLNYVEIIGEGAFELCENLSEIDLSNVKHVGAGAFAGCTKLSETDGVLELPKAITVGASAFSGCENLKSVRFGSFLSEIGDNAFMECHIYDDNKPLFIEFSGPTPPTLGSSIGLGCISIKLKAPSIGFVLACYETPSWHSYIAHLYLESGAEKGLYMDGAIALRLDGRAVFNHSDVYMYQISGSNVSFYLYDKEFATMTEIKGSFKDGVICVTLPDGEGNPVGYAFEKTSEEGVKTFTSSDGKYTLVVNPKRLDYTDETNSSSTVTFNGKETTLKIYGNSFRITSYVDSDGKKYDFTLKLDKGYQFDYDKTRPVEILSNITASDGSVINLRISDDVIYVYGQLNIDLGGGITLPEFSDGGTTAVKVSENVYSFIRPYRSDNYKITVTLSQDQTTFTYEYEKV